MRVRRLLALLDALRVHRRPVSAAALAEAQGVSARTIYRDIAVLQSLGAPVRGEAGIGYQLERGHFLPPVTLDTDEAEAVALGLSMVDARGDAPLGAAAARARAKLGAVLPEAKRETFRALPLAASARATPEADRARSLLAPLRAAIRDRAEVQIDYERLDGVATRRRARPLGLTAFDSVWLLTIWCETAVDFRHLRVDRIRLASRTGVRFRDAPGLTFSDYLTRRETGRDRRPAGPSVASSAGYSARRRMASP